MGIVSIGRSLVIRQLLLTGLVIALGAFAYVSLGDIEIAAHGLVGADSVPPPTGTAAVLGAIDTVEWRIFLATLVVAILMTAVSIPIIHFTVGRPVKAMAEAMHGLAAGDSSVAIAGDERSDELGVMARAMIAIRASAVEQSKNQATILRSDSDTRLAVRASSINQSIERFSEDFSFRVQRLATMTKRLSDAAAMMIVATGHASDGSGQAISASSNAAGDVSSVATASEQLLDSIEEISRQVVQSTNVVKSAVERAVETNAGMGRLSAAAQKVGDVVSLISRIAAQTNLLALNATIEAARAGEAGRGFAVVAQEVKTLATQTAKATQDITGQIAEMQEATDLSVEAIDKIQKKISEVEHISTIIAAAVHEQGAATQEIARNVRSAAAGTQMMSSQIENVVRSVDETSNNATSVAKLASELDEIAAGMNGLIASFTASIKAA